MKKKILVRFKNIFIGGLISLLFLSFNGNSYTLAKEGPGSSLITLDVCRDVAKSKLYWYPEWYLAEIGSEVVYYDLKNKSSAYVFSVVKNDKILGYIAMSAREDYFPIIQYALGQTIPSTHLDRCRQIASNRTSGKLGNPRFLYLGGIDYLVSFPIEGINESITVGLKSGRIYSQETLNQMQSILDSRTDEQKSKAKKAWDEEIFKKKTPQKTRAPRQLLEFDEKYLSGVEGYTYYRGGGPPSAAMLFNYYGTTTSPLGFYPALYYRPGTFTWYGAENGTYTPYCPRTLVDSIADCIQLPNRGGEYKDYGVTSSQIASAIDEVAKKHGYIFHSTHLSSGGVLTYSNKFKGEIDANRPFLLALGEAKIKPEIFSITFAFGYKYKKTPTADEHFIRVYNPYDYLETYGVISPEDILLENQYGIFAVFSTPPPIDIQPDKIAVYHRWDPTTRQLSYPEPLFKQGSTVYVTVSDGTNTGPALITSDIYVTQLSHKSTITVTVRDDGTGYDMRAYDGIYTGRFDFDALGLGNGETGVITANLNNGTMQGSFTITAEYIPPAFIDPPTVSKPIFSPNVLPGTTTISFTARDDLIDGTWTYIITIDNGIIPFGTGSTGSNKGSNTVSFDWNGRDVAGNLLLDGTHTITVVIGDLAENFEIKTTWVIIDTIQPLIENPMLSDYFFSPPSPKGTTTITFNSSDTYGIWSYVLLVGTRTLCGSGSPMGTQTTKSQVVFDWNGKVKTNDGEILLGEGVHTITILLTDFVGNTSSATLSARIDRTNPWSSALTASRYIFSPHGIYPTTLLSFTAGDVDSPWQYSISVNGQVLGGEGATGTRPAGTSTVNFTWDGSPLDAGTQTITLTIIDSANNTISTSTTVIIDVIKPTITNLYASSYYFSSLHGATVSITFTGNDNLGTWGYELKVDGYTPGGIGTATGTCFGSQTIIFIWDGSPVSEEGTHTVSVNLTDFAGNINSSTIQIYIDNTSPTIETLTASDYYISHTGEDKTTIISFYGNDNRDTWRYSLIIGTRSLGGDIPYGTKTGKAKVEFTWNGKDDQGNPFNEGENIVIVTLTDLAGNTKTSIISIFIDNTPPQVSTLTSTIYYFSIPSVGTPTVAPTLKFTANDEYENWYYEFRINGRIPGGTPPATGTSIYREVNVGFTWNGRDINGYLYWQDTHLVMLTVKDVAGNISTRTTTIAIDNTPPTLENFNVTPLLFSYKGSPATITFTAEDNESATWTYKITVTNRGREVIPVGQGMVSGEYGQKQTVIFLWNGYYGDNIPCSDGMHEVKVTVEDLAGNSRVATTTVEMESTDPTIISSKIRRNIISPVSYFQEYRSTQLTFKANDNNKTWKYHLSIGTFNPVCIGTGLAPDTFTTEGTKTVNLFWGGYVETNGTITLLSDGLYFLTLTVYDKMNNTDNRIFPIIIDTVGPLITEVTNDVYGIKYINEQILFKLKADEEGLGTILLGTTSLESAEEVITGDKKISLNEGFSQFEVGYPGGEIEVFAIDRNTGTVTSYQFKINNYTLLSELINDINSKISGIGTITYSTNTDKFIITCSQSYRLALQEYEIEAWRIGFWTAIKLPVGYVELFKAETGEYKGYYKVPKMACMSVVDVFGRFLDNGGNWASNNGTWTGSILLDGSQKVPVGNSRIAGIRIDPAPETMTFNTKKTQLTLSMVVVDVAQDLSTLQKPTIRYGTDSAIIQHPNIAKDMQIIVWHDYLGKPMINTHSRVWRVTAGENGTITISNNTLYFGNPIGTYSSPWISDAHIYVVSGTFTTSGMASVDVGILQSGIKLYDDGNIDYHRDESAFDGIYTGIFNVPDKIEAKNIPIICHYVGPNAERVLNDGYPFNDKEKLPFSYPEYDTDVFNNIYINIDTVCPKVRVIGVTTPFNPYKDKKAEIKYLLEDSITARVKVIIKQGNEIIKDLGFRQVIAGDNVLYWDGKDELGNIVKDGNYRFYIDAQDDAENTTEETIYGSIKVTSVMIKIDELTIDISKPTPKGDKLVIDQISVCIKAKIEASKSQLENLDFEFNPYFKDSKYDIGLYNKPYALFYITLHDSTGKIIDTCEHDWTKNNDTDPNIFDLPNYYIKPEDRDPAENEHTILGISLPDYGDENKCNDWDTLVPFDRDELENEECKDYTSEFKGTIIDLEVPQGTYYIRVLTKLVAGCWHFVDWLKDSGGIIIGEKWYFKPDYFHYGLISIPKEQRFEVIREEYPETDNTPPDIYESFPLQAQVVAPGEVVSGEENMAKVVCVRVKDEETGVNFEKSWIKLKDAKGRTIDGQPKHDGIDKLYWILNKSKYPDGLTIPGEYSIEIRVLDKATNEKTDVYKFVVQDKMPPEIIFTTPIDQSVFGEFETIGMKLEAIISEKDTGNSDIDWDKSKILLFKDSLDISSQLTRYEPSKVDENYGIIRYSITSLSVGTYTMKIEAWDKSTTPGPNSTTKVITFYVTSEGYIYVKLGDLIYLSIPPMTWATCTTTGSGTLVDTTTITVGTASDTPPAHEGLEAIKPSIKFLFQKKEGRIIFSRDVIMTMHYTEADVAKLSTLGLTEKDLTIYEADML